MDIRNVRTPLDFFENSASVNVDEKTRTFKGQLNPGPLGCFVASIFAALCLLRALCKLRHYFSSSTTICGSCLQIQNRELEGWM
jgi:hypothetical protein